MPASQVTIVALGPYSVRIFTSIEAKPKIALVGSPVDVAIDSGRAKNARYASELPSMRKSSSCWSVIVAMAVQHSVRIARGGGGRRMPCDERFCASYASRGDRRERPDHLGDRARSPRVR